MRRKSIFITGSSSGIGKATANIFVEKDWNVIATMRSPEKESELAKVPGILLLALDVTKPDSIKKAAAEAIARFRQIDVVINNAGYGTMGPFEASTAEQIKKQFDTNLFGLMEVMRAFLPHFRQKRSGLFINVSSMGGRTGFPLYSLYNSTKFAVEGFSEAIQYELEHFNIKVKLIEPGVIKTDFYHRSADRETVGALPEYQSFTTKASVNMDKMQEKGTSAEEVARIIYKAATDNKNQLRYVAGSDAKQLAWVKRFLPENWVLAILKRMLTK